MDKYESEFATLYHGDAADVVELIEPKSVGLIATDPPYGVKWQSNRRIKAFEKLAGDDGSLDVPAVLGVYARRTLQPRRHAYVFGYAPDALSEPMQFGGTTELVWDKGNVGMGDLALPWAPQWERIAFGVKTPSAANRAAGDGNLAARLRQGNVLRIDRKNSRAVTKHSTEKPVSLMRMLIESSSVLGDLVCDPFAGSGSTAVAAIVSGRRFVGCEIDPTYFETAVERIKQAETAYAAMVAL